MRNLILLFLMIFAITTPAFADAVYDSRGSVISGVIDGVSGGLIQIKNNGNIVTLVRHEPSPVYKDSVEARVHLISKQTIKYSGNVIYVDNASVKILCEDAKVVIPRYRVNKIEMFIP